MTDTANPDAAGAFSAPEIFLGREPDEKTLDERLRTALWEDAAPRGDLTSAALVPPDARAVAELTAKAAGILCGAACFARIFELAAAEVGGEIGGKVEVDQLRRDGERVRPGDLIARLQGNARALLLGERTALNLLCRLSGIASLTARFVAEVAGTHAVVADTRKTTPLWRDLEKYAVRCGGGKNHRFNLAAAVLIKDNHLALWGDDGPAGAVRAAQEKFPEAPVFVEVEDLRELDNVCRNSAPYCVLLDNFTAPLLRKAVRVRNEIAAARGEGEKPRPLLEASGGVSLENLREVAETGVDRVSCGALTHSAPALDFSLNFLPPTAAVTGP